MVPILEEFARGGQLQKKFGDRATIIGVGLMGPRKNCLEEQLDRTKLLKVNLANNVFHSTCRLSGLRDPNKPIILKLKNGEFFTPGNRTTTVHELFRNMRVDGDNLNGGEGRPPLQRSFQFAAADEREDEEGRTRGPGHPRRVLNRGSKELRQRGD